MFYHRQVAYILLQVMRVKVLVGCGERGHDILYLLWPGQDHLSGLKPLPPGLDNPVRYTMTSEPMSS